MRKNINGVLSELGYNMNLKGAKYTEGAVYQMLSFINSSEEKNKLKQDLINAKKDEKESEEEITDEVLIAQMLSMVHVEAYHFEYEIRRKLYFARIKQFLTSNNETGQNISDLEHYECDFEIDEDEVNNMLMGLVNFFNNDKELVFESSEEKLDVDNMNMDISNKIYIRKYDSTSDNCSI